MIQEVTPKLAVIIINHHHGDMLKRAVESIMNSSYDKPYQVFVINNLKDDAIKKWLTQAFPDIELIENDKPKGFASNNNQIIAEHADFDYYLLVNPDATCLSGMLSQLIVVMEDNPKIGVAGPRLINPDGTVQPSRRRFASFLVLLVRALHIDVLFKGLAVVDHYLMNDVEFNDIAEVDWITGAVMILRKKALEDAGLFDERFFMYFEDEDLCCRMWQQGWKVCYLNAAVAYHEHIAEGRKKILSKANFHHIGSAFKMLLKYQGRIVRCYDKGAVKRVPLSTGK